MTYPRSSGLLRGRSAAGMRPLWTVATAPNVAEEAPITGVTRRWSNAEDYRAVVAAVKPGLISSEGYLVGVQALAVTGDGITVFQRQALEDALSAYGEDDVLSAVRAGLRRDQVEAIGRIHCRLIHETDP